MQVAPRTAISGTGGASHPTEQRLDLRTACGNACKTGIASLASTTFDQRLFSELCGESAGARGLIHLGSTGL